MDRTGIGRRDLLGVLLAGLRYCINSAALSFRASR